MRIPVPVLVFSIVFLSPATALESLEKVTFSSAVSGTPSINAYLLRPTGAGPFPAVVALPGCSNGGSSILRAAAPGNAPSKTGFVTVIVFYPSCRWALKKIWEPACVR